MDSLARPAPASDPQAPLDAIPAAASWPEALPEAMAPVPAPEPLGAAVLSPLSDDGGREGDDDGDCEDEEDLSEQAPAPTPGGVSVFGPQKYVRTTGKKNV